MISVIVLEGFSGKPFPKPAQTAGHGSRGLFSENTQNYSCDWVGSVLVGLINHKCACRNGS